MLGGSIVRYYIYLQFSSLEESCLLNIGLGRSILLRLSAIAINSYSFGEDGGVSRVNSSGKGLLDRLARLQSCHFPRIEI